MEPQKMWIVTMERLGSCCWQRLSRDSVNRAS
jgi:hypothetical protein